MVELTSFYGHYIGRNVWLWLKCVKKSSENELFVSRDI